MPVRWCRRRSHRLKYFGHDERHHTVQAHIGDIEFLMLGIQRDGKWFLKPCLLPGDRPFRRDVSIIVKTPHSDEYPRWLHSSLNTGHCDYQQFAGGVDRHLIDPIDLRVRSSDDVERLDVSVCQTIKHQDGSVASGHRKHVVEWIDRDRASGDLRIRTANGTLGPHITITVEREYQDIPPAGHEDLTVHDVDVEPVRPVELGVWSLNDAN